MFAFVFSKCLRVNGICVRIMQIGTNQVPSYVNDISDKINLCKQTKQFVKRFRKSQSMVEQFKNKIRIVKNM